MKKINLGISLLAFVLVVATANVSAYHMRGYYSGSPGLMNQPDHSEYIYKVASNRDWVVQGIANPSGREMEYRMVNSNGETRGLPYKSSSTFSPKEISSSGQAGYAYRLRITKKSGNPFEMFHIEAKWDTDKNR